ncbi:MAG: GNAT family N-acetyltransferase [Bacteroidetes bacterium]|nr:GNAT family N-acetyltransferase [Bacteroidota bacterium]
MVTIIRTDSENQDFMVLVNQLDAELAILDGDDHAFYAQFNKTDKLKFVLLAYEGRRPIGCGAIREYAPGIIEVKRMYTVSDYRGKGIASMILAELEAWAQELLYDTCVLETGKRQPDALGLYKKCGYNIIPNYGQYAQMANSVCFEKRLSN